VSFEKVCIGPHTLFRGDCLEVLPTLGKVDAVVTDPPYGIQDAAFQMGKREGKRVGGDNTWHPPSDWDAEINPEWCKAACEVSAVVAWFGHWRMREHVAAAMPHRLRAEIVWAKDCHVGPPCPLAMRDERIWLFSVAGIKGRKFETTVWDEPIIPTWARKLHKNEKPQRLMSRLVRFITDEGDTVLDPFSGSGTTGAACVKLGRNFIGVEKDTGHFDIACKRIEDALHAEPLLAEAG
jgi:DNA modification methylase